MPKLGKIAQNNAFIDEQREAGRDTVHPSELPFPSCANRTHCIIGKHQGYLLLAAKENTNASK